MILTAITFRLTDCENKWNVLIYCHLVVFLSKRACVIELLIMLPFSCGRLFVSVKSFRLYRYTCSKHVNNQGFTNLVSVGASLIRAISWYRTKLRVIVSYLCDDDLNNSLIPRAVFIFTGLKQDVCLFFGEKNTYQYQIDLWLWIYVIILLSLSLDLVLLPLISGKHIATSSTVYIFIIVMFWIKLFNW